MFYVIVKHDHKRRKGRKQQSLLYSEVLETGHHRLCRAVRESTTVGPKAETRRGNPRPESFLAFLREGVAGQEKGFE